MDSYYLTSMHLYNSILYIVVFTAWWNNIPNEGRFHHGSLAALMYSLLSSNGLRDPLGLQQLQKLSALHSVTTFWWCLLKYIICNVSWWLCMFVCFRCYEVEQTREEREKHPINQRVKHPLYPVSWGLTFDIFFSFQILSSPKW